MTRPDADRAAALLAVIERSAPEALELARWMGANPELSLEEHATSARYRERLGGLGFAIESEVAGMPTAFLARHGAEDAPLTAALLAEMDALPEIGHACGHNLSGPASLLAAEALAAVVPPELLKIVVVGCPAEETGVGKRQLVEAGVFAEADVAMMAHASDMRRAHRLFLGNRKFEFVFHGKAAHAAAYPEEGINALDAVISLFVNVGLLRQQLPRSARIHGIVSDGGQAPNIIPERAAGLFWVRALEDDVLEDAAARLVACAEGAAAATHTRLETRPAAGESPPMHANLPLADTYRRQLERLELPETAHAPGQAIGSSDITHVSRVVPTIHPNFPIGENLQLHTRAFAEATATPGGEAGLLEGARALALTVLELAHAPDTRAAVAAAHTAPPANPEQ
ncbi:MAG: amidohydrolase [Myxococcota bacterium]